VPTLLGFVPRANPIERLMLPQHACITVTSGERRILALIDTRSDITLTGRLLAEQLSWDIEPTNLWWILAANDDGMSILGVCNVKLGVGRRHLKTHVYISSQIHQMILRSDWLAEQRQVTWDFANAMIRLGTLSEWMPLRREPSRHPCVFMLRSEGWRQTPMSSVQDKAVQTDLWIQVQKMDGRCCVVTIQMQHPIHFRKEANQQLTAPSTF